MNNQFNLKIVLKEEKTKNSLSVKYKYYKDNEDKISFNICSINICGQRSSEKAITEFKKSDNNKLYKELRLCIVTHYLMYGKKISDCKYLLTINGKEIEQDDLNKIFDLDLFSEDTKDTILTRNIVKSIFNENYPKKIEVSAINYIKGLNNNDDNLNYYWKSFEAIAGYISKTINESEILNHIANIINNDSINTKELNKFVLNNKDSFITDKNMYTCKNVFYNKINVFAKKNINENSFQEINKVLKNIYNHDIVELMVKFLKGNIEKDKEELLRINSNKESKAFKKIESFLSLPARWDFYKKKYLKQCIDPSSPEVCFVLYFAYSKRNEIFHGNNTEPILRIKEIQQDNIYTLINEYLKTLIKVLYLYELL